MQHGFIRGKSTTTQLLEVYHEILESVASGNEVDAIYPDFSKAFDKVPHHLLLKKLETLGIRGSLLTWFERYLEYGQQRVVIHGVCSDWLPVTSGVPQGSILGPLLFLVYCNDIPRPSFFADDYHADDYYDDRFLRMIKNYTEHFRLPHLLPLFNMMFLI